MIEPDSDRVREFFGKRSENEIVRQILSENPWYFENLAIDFTEWAREVVTAFGFNATCKLALVGSGTVGFSLSPTKPGAPFRGLDANAEGSNKPSDLDFALISPELFDKIWSAMVREDALLGAHSRPDNVRIRIYWGRIQDDAVPHSAKAQVKSFTNLLRRQKACRSRLITLRIYRRSDDLQNYLTWSLNKLMRVVRK